MPQVFKIHRFFRWLDEGVDDKITQKELYLTGTKFHYPNNFLKPSKGCWKCRLKTRDFFQSDGDEVCRRFSWYFSNSLFLYLCDVTIHFGFALCLGKIINRFIDWCSWRLGIWFFWKSCESPKDNLFHVKGICFTAVSSYCHYPDFAFVQLWRVTNVTNVEPQRIQNSR